MEFNRKAVFDQIRAIIEVLTKRFFEIFDYLIDHKIIVKEEESSTGA